jgi:hypothetical protein
MSLEILMNRFFVKFCDIYAKLHILRGLVFGITVLPFALLGGCNAWIQYYDKIANADLRAIESFKAVATVRKLGEESELQYENTGRVPSMEDLNCNSLPCKPYTFITRSVSIDSEGIIHATHDVLGVPFSPFSTFKVTWDSKSRTTNRDRLVEPWQWRVSYLVSLILSIGFAAIPWLPKLCRMAYRRFYGSTARLIDNET